MKKKTRRSGKKKTKVLLVLGVAAILIVALCTFLIINSKSDKKDKSDTVKYETTEKYTDAAVSLDNTDEDTKAEKDTTKSETGGNSDNSETDKSEITVVKKTIEKKDTLSGGGSAVLDITYPNIPSSEYNEKADIFNEAVVDKIDLIIFEYDTNLNEYSDLEILNYTVNYTLCKNTDNIVSVIFNTESFFGGAHENNFYSSINFSMETGKLLTLNDILGGDKTDKIVNYVYDKIVADPSEYYPEISLQSVKDSFNEENFALVDDKIKVFFQDYDIAPYAAGFQSFDIPISELK